MVCSFLFGLLGLGHPVDDAVGWFGIYVQKNELGKMALLSALVFWYLSKIDVRGRWSARAGVLLSVTLIYLSNSMTALVLLPLMFGLQISLRAFRHSRRVGVAVLGVAGVLGVAVMRWAITHAYAAAGARGLTLSGRITLWILAVVMALKRPWLGYGYYAFWQGMNGPSSRILVALNIGMPHAHNGFLDLWLNLGIVGVAVFAIGFITYVRRACSFVDWQSPDSSWPLMYLAFILLYNLTESTLLVPNSLFWALYAAAAFSVSAQLENSPAQLPLGGHQVAYGVR
jgi:exopolysaccharide production protein ExoQ